MTNAPEIYLRQMELGPMENFVYLIGDPITRCAIVVDPAWQVDTILKQAAKDEMKIVGALVSHHHGDHTNGIPELLEAVDCPVYVNKHDAEFVKLAGDNLVKSDNGDEINIGDLRIRMVHTPGHTPGSQCFQVHRHLVSGDTLFIKGCGRCDLPGGDPQQMYYTMTQKLMQMADDTILLPGHNYSDKPTSTLGEEKQENPYLRIASRSLQDFIALRMGGRR